MLSTVLEFIGCALVVAGVAIVSVPAAMIVAGVLVVASSILRGPT